VGAAGLGDNELLAIVIGGGTAGADALDLANTVLATAGGLRGLLRLAAEDLVRLRGLGRARSAQVLAAVEIGRRVMTREPGERLFIASPRDAAALLLPEYGARPVEQFGIVLLDTRHRVLQTRLISTGSLDAALAQPRQVFREAVLASASAIVLFHNHPSGDPHPSGEDIEVTLRMVAAGELMGVAVIDHLVLGDGRYCSLKESGAF
jgi:DNA repair protein RadC